MRLIIFGAGQFYENRRNYFIGDTIVGFVDNSREKQGSCKERIRIYAPEQLQNLKFDYIILMSRQYGKMRMQLAAMHIPADRILDFFQYERRKFLEGRTTAYYDNYKYTEREGKRGSIVLFSHELSLTGAPVVLLYMAEILKAAGYNPVVVSCKDGGLRDEFVRKGMPVIVTTDITVHNPVLGLLLRDAIMVLFNTLMFLDVIEEFVQTGSRTVWWLHEPEMAYRKELEYYLKCLSCDRMSILAVSNMTANAFKKHSGYTNVRVFPYGIPDERERMQGEEKHSGKTIFAVIGAMQERKAQDVFIHAVRALGEEERGEAEFWIVGSETQKSYCEQIKEDASGIPEIKFTGEKTREEIQEIYRQVDVIVCPSRSDPLPVVLAEGLMWGKICIASRGTGMADFIEDKVNGLLCEKDDIQSLCYVMQWILQHVEAHDTIGRNGRKLYEDRFSMGIFRKAVLELAGRKDNAEDGDGINESGIKSNDERGLYSR